MFKYLVTIQLHVQIKSDAIPRWWERKVERWTWKFTSRTLSGLSARMTKVLHSLSLIKVFLLRCAVIFIQAESLYHYILRLHPCSFILVPSLRWQPPILVSPGCIPADELKFVMNHLPGKVELHCYQSSHRHSLIGDASLTWGMDFLIHP